MIEQNEDNNNINLIHIDIKYVENDKNKNVSKNVKTEDYEIIPNELSKGEELSKLIINNYLLKNKNLEKEAKIKIALKYQILSDDTSLFAEVELSKKISKEMKSKIIGNKEDNIIKKFRPKYYDNDYLDLCDSIKESSYRCIKSSYSSSVHLRMSPPQIKSVRMKMSSKKKSACPIPSFDFSFCKNIGNSIKRFFSKSDKDTKKNVEFIPEQKIDDYKNCEDNKIYEKEEKEEKEVKTAQKVDLNNKDDLMKMINTQDFISGFWDINEQTKIIKEKYEKKFESLKKIKDGKLNDKIIITILIIYFINKEYPELLKELVMIIKKGKSFIQEKTEETYENILKEIGIN
jgi:hypothetical protein